MNKKEFYGLLETIKVGEDAKRNFFGLIYDKAKEIYLVRGGHQRASFCDFSIDKTNGFQLEFCLPGGDFEIIRFASADEFFDLDLGNEVVQKQKEAEEKEQKQQQAKEEEEKAMFARLKAKYEPEEAQ